MTHFEVAGNLLSESLFLGDTFN